MPNDDDPRLPASHTNATLQANLAALDRTDPRLAERVRLPVADTSVRFDDRGQAQYRLHRELVPLTIPAAEERRLVGGLRTSSVFVAGIGAGELIDAALAREDVTRLVAWERDPWILRLELMRCDHARDILRGRLRFALGVDLLDLPLTGDLLEHPVLGQVYRGELEHVGRPLGVKRAAVCHGGLFVDEVRRALRERGYSLWTLDVLGLSGEELARTMERFHPALVVSIGYVDGLAEFCDGYGARLCCWEVDPSLAPPRPVEGTTDHAFVFTYRRANVAAYRAAGFRHVEALPLAADPDLRRPLDLSAEERRDFGAPVGFVGSSMVANAARCRERLLALWRDFGPDGGPLAEGAATLERVLDAQREDFETYRVPELLEREAPGFAAAAAEGGAVEDVTLLVGELAASQKRLAYLERLAPAGLSVWGDDGWRRLEPRGVRYRGFAGHRQQLTRIYNATQVNLDVGRLFQADIVTMRTFDVLACGAFALVEHTAELERVFEVGREVESYRDAGELERKVRHFLAHPNEARAIAERGREALLNRHTIDLRLRHMLARVEGRA